MRDKIYARLVAADVGGVVAVSAMEDVPLPETRPFLAYRIGASQPVMKDGNVTICLGADVQVWAYDSPGDYGRIEDALTTVREVMETTVGDVEIVQIRYLDDSDDLPLDPDMGVISRFSRYRVIWKP